MDSTCICKINSYNSFNLFLVSTIAGYFSLYLILGNVGLINFPPENILFIQCGSLFAFGLFYGIGVKLHHISSLLLLIFIYQLVLSVLLFCSHSFEYNSDYYAYSSWAWEPIHYYYDNYIKYISNNTLDISDWGYPIFLNWIYSLTGEIHGGDLLMCVCNVFINISTVLLLWKLTYQMFGVKIAKLTLLLWGLNVYNIWFNATGLKETLFTFFMVGGFYFLYKVSVYNKLRHYIWLMAFIFIIVFFRYYISIFFLLIVISLIFFRRIYEKYFALIMLFAFTVVILGVDLLAFFIEEVAVIYKNQAGVWGDNGILFSIMNVYSAFVSPYPALSGGSLNQNQLTLLFSIFKISLSFWGIYGMYLLIKTKQTRVYPLINILLFNIFLTIISGLSLNYRYMHITMPLYIVFMIYGYVQSRHKVLIALFSWGTGGFLTLLYNL